MTMTDSNPQEQRTARQLQNRIAQQAGSLRDRLQSALDTLADPPTRPGQMTRRLGLNKTLASRLLAALRTDDPLACAHALPGPEALRLVTKAIARATQADPEATASQAGSPLLKANEAIDAFDHLIRNEVGGRSALDAIITDALPDARAKFDLANRQAMSKAVANLKGVSTEVEFSTAIICPTDDPNLCAPTFLGGYLGLRRIRPGALVRIATSLINPSRQPTAAKTIEGGPLDELKSGVLIEAYCTKPTPELVTTRHSDAVHHALQGETVGIASAVDIIMGERLGGVYGRYQPKGERTRVKRVWAANETVIASRLLILDMILHEDIWPGCSPEVRIYDTIVQGSAAPNDPSRDADLLAVHDPVQSLGTGVSRFRVAEMPRYTELLEYTCRCLGYRGDQFRAFRARIEYPFYGSQTMILLDPPVLGE